MKSTFIISLFASALALAGGSGCSGAAENTPLPTTTMPAIVQGDPAGVVLAGATPEEIARFADGDSLFEVSFRDADGLGPLYIRSSCGACHKKDLRGPGVVGKMAVVADDGFTPSDDQSPLPYGHTERPYSTAGATQPILCPKGDARMRLTYRMPPAVLGRGYMEAVADSEIEALARQATSRTDGIRGRINRVTYASEANPETRFHSYQKGQGNLIGRFGLKGRIATLDEFAADAFQGDMGITSPMRTAEPANPDGLTDDGKAGIDTDLRTVNAVGDYMRLLAIPVRRDHTAAGKALFEETRCSACHVPQLHTRPDYPIHALADVDAPVFTDFLLHDMGPTLADGMVDGAAGSREWKTAPLIALRFMTSYLHDGRALTIEDAIVAHGGDQSEAADSVSRFAALSAADRAELIRFVRGL